MEKAKKISIKNSEITIDFIYYLYFIVAVGVKVFYLQFTTGLNVNEASFNNVNENTMRAALSIILMIFSVFFVLFKKRRNGALFVVNLILGIIFLGDTLYYRYYQMPLSVSLVYQIGVVGDVKGSMASLFRLKDIVYFIDLPIYFIFFFVKRWIKKRYPLFAVKRRFEFPIAILIMIVSVIMFNSCYNKSNTILYNYDRNYAAKDLSVLYYHYYDTKNFLNDEIEKNKPLTANDKQMVTDYFDNKQKLENPKYKGIAKDRNLIVVQVEALQSFVLENTIENQEITPFLNSLINESVYMENIYHQVAGGNTADAEFMINNSLYPIESGAVNFRYPNNLYHSLGNVLKFQNYKTYAAHAYKPSFWNRQNFYKSEGFDEFYDLNKYNLDEIIGWALSDESFFRQTFDKIDLDSKFYSFNVTLSSHHPYDAFIKTDDLDVGKYKDKQLGNFLKSANYVDYALKQLFNSLKEKGIYDNSIIVIYGDHSALFEDQKEDLCEYTGIEYNEFNWKKLQRVPVIIHVPNTDLVERVEKVGAQIDILPTIANLMDLNMPYVLGKDMLNIPNDNGYAVLRYSSVITDDYMYLSDTGKYYDMKTGDVIDAETYADDLESKLLDLKVSDIIINKDYFRKTKDR